MNAQLFFRDMKVKENDRKEDSVLIWHSNNLDFSCNAKEFLDWLSGLNKNNINDITFKGLNFEFRICEEKAGLFAYFFNNEKLNYDYRFIENGKIKSEYILEDMLNLKNNIELRYGLYGRNSKTIFTRYQESSIFKFKLPSKEKEFGTIIYENWSRDDHIAILDMFINYYKNKNGSYEFGSESEPGYEYTSSTGLKIIDQRIYYFTQIFEYIDGEKDEYLVPSMVENHEYLLLGTPEQIASELCADMEREKDSWANCSGRFDDKEKSKIAYLNKLSELQMLVRKY